MVAGNEVTETASHAAAWKWFPRHLRRWITVFALKRLTELGMAVSLQPPCQKEIAYWLLEQVPGPQIADKFLPREDGYAIDFARARFVGD